MLSKLKKIPRLIPSEFKKFSQRMSSEFKKFSRPTIGLIYVFGILLTVYTLRPLFWTGGTGISNILDTIFWGDVKQSEPVVSKTVEKVEKDKQGKTVKTIETIKYDDGKTVWDWLSLLGVPLTLFFLGAWLQQEQQERARKLSEEQEERAKKFAEEQRDIADNETKEEVLQTYFDRLSVLLIDRNLIALSNKSNSPKITSISLSNKSNSSTITPEEQELLDSSLDVIRARTLSILRRFKNDAERKTSVIKFLIETEIIGKSKLNLSEANLEGANLEGAYLKGAYLLYANLFNAYLFNANLYRANLWGASLKGAFLLMANLSEANLSWAFLSGANLQGASLLMANLSGSNLSGAKFSWANLSGANLSEANLSGANLERANLSGANLEDIQWNSETVWPDKSAFAKAKNIPEELKKELGITP
jgi:uncharacterized protein YjbI with pentapeptide repeats